MGKFDEILDDVVFNAKTAASAVSKKAATVYEASRHKISASEIRGEINKKLKDLGKYTYKASVYGIDMSEQINAAVEEISELKENLDIINAHIDDIKNQKKCPKCEAKIPKNSKFCNICGAKLDDYDDVFATDDIDDEEVDADKVIAEAEQTAEANEEAAAEETAE